MMATVRHVTSSSGLRKFQTDGFLFIRVYKILSLTTHIQHIYWGTISTFLNLSNLLHSFLLNFSTSILTYELLIKSYLCSALIRIILVWFAFITNSDGGFIPTVEELFLTMSLKPPIAPLHLSLLTVVISPWKCPLRISSLILD